jgi:hypothetical protein
MNSKLMYIKTAGVTSNGSSFYAMNTAFSHNRNEAWALRTQHDQMKAVQHADND